MSVHFDGLRALHFIDDANLDVSTLAAFDCKELRAFYDANLRAPVVTYLDKPLVARESRAVRVALVFRFQLRLGGY